MVLNVNDLRPFQSLLFLEVESGPASDPGQLKLRLSNLVKAIDGTKPIKWSPAASTEGQLTTLYATYVREKQAPWTSNPDFTDRQHHLIVVSAMASLYCLYMSDGALQERVARAVAQDGAADWSGVRLVPSGRLNALFVKGRTKTLWLRGVHARSSFKPDQKVLSGLNLVDALDPLGDQSYTFTAARCQGDLAGVKAPYGVAPLKSRAWFGQSKDWQAYRTLVERLLTWLSATRDEQIDPLPVLSIPTDGIQDLSQLGDVFDVSVIPEAVLSPAELSEEGGDEAGVDLEVEVRAGTPPLLTVAVRDLQSERSGNYTLKVDLHEGSVQCEFTAPGEQAEDHTLLPTLQALRGQLTIHFSNGISAAAGRLHRVRYRDLPFDGFKWSSFAGSDIDTEKPKALSPEKSGAKAAPLSAATIGKERSLFCWVLRSWRSGKLPWECKKGWLACNDGSLELADFIHFDPLEPRLTLIHVKATKGDEKRSIAVSPFEVVVAQAIKNLRHVDPEIAGTEFSERVAKHVQEAVWNNGKPAKRSQMLAALKKAGAGVARRVVVVHPHVRKSARVKAMKATEGSQQRHLVRQLHALLLGAQHDCAALGADFLVVGHDS